MATVYTWHPGNGGINSVWVAKSPLMPDESISSWLVRTALIQGCDPLHFTGYYWPKWRIWSLDVDRFIKKDQLAPIVKDSGISWIAFRKSMLRPLIQKTCSGRLPTNAVWPWVLATGVRGRRYRGGMQYCPACLAEDKVSYFRLQWRLSWHICCSKHNLWLLDQCWSCKSSIGPHRVTLQDGSVCICPVCKSDLRQAAPESMPMKVGSFQVLMDNKLSAKAPAQMVPATRAWFMRARSVLYLLKYAGDHPRGKLAQMFSSIEIDVSALAPTNGLQFELRPIKSRLPLLDSLARTMLISNKKCGKLSEVLEECIQKEMTTVGGGKKATTRDKRLKGGVSQVARTEFEPKSKKAVMRRWTLFLRRHDLR